MEVAPEREVFYPGRELQIGGSEGIRAAEIEAVINKLGGDEKTVMAMAVPPTKLGMG